MDHGKKREEIKKVQNDFIIKKQIKQQLVSIQANEKNDDEKEEKKTKKKTKNKYRILQKQKNFAATIGIEDNQKYKKFKTKENLIMNISNSKYFVVRFVAKNLFGFKLSYKNQDVEQMDNWNYDQQTSHAEDWDIYWTDGGVLPERIAKMKPY